MAVKQIVAGSAGVLLVVGASLGSFTLVQASGTSDMGPQHVNCTNATLEGRYAVTGSGFIPGGPPPAPLVPSMHVSLMTMDGAGNLSDKVTVVGPDGVLRDLAQGTYTVNADCTGELIVQIPGPPFQLTWDLVVADLQGGNGGSEFYAISTVPGAVSTFTAKRIR